MWYLLACFGDDEVAPVEEGNTGPTFSYVGPESDGLRPVQTEDGWGYIDADKNLVVPPNFTAAAPFREGLGRIEGPGGVGFVDKAGVVVVRPAYLDARSFSGGRAWVRFQTGDWGAIDVRGHVVIDGRPSPYENTAPWARRLVMKSLGGSPTDIRVDRGPRYHVVVGDTPSVIKNGVLEESPLPEGISGPTPPDVPGPDGRSVSLPVDTLDLVVNDGDNQRVMVQEPYDGSWSIGSVAWDGDNLLFDNTGAVACIWDLDTVTGVLEKIVPEHGAVLPAPFRFKRKRAVAYAWGESLWVASPAPVGPWLGIPSDLPRDWTMVTKEKGKWITQTYCDADTPRVILSGQDLEIRGGQESERYLVGAVKRTDGGWTFTGADPGADTPSFTDHSLEWSRGRATGKWNGRWYMRSDRLVDLATVRPERCEE